MIPIVFAVLLQAATVVPADSGEGHLTNIRQLTFGGQNAEAYFSRSGRQIIFQRQEADTGCDQQYVINVDGSGMHRVSSGDGRTTCGYFFDRDRRICERAASSQQHPHRREKRQPSARSGIEHSAGCFVQLLH